MEKSDSLFDLVQRLDDSEYAFIVQYAECGRKEPKNMLALLKAMRAMPQYDAKSLKGRFANLNSKRFHLRQHIMESLRAYREGNTVDRRIRALILDYEILYEKGIYDEAIRTLHKAQQLAEEHQNMALLLEIIRLQQHRLLEQETKDLPLAIQDRVEAANKALAAYQQQWQMINDYHTSFAQFRQEERREPDATLHVVPDALLDDPQVPFLTRQYGFMLAVLQARNTGDKDLVCALHERTLAIWEAHKELTADFQGRYKILAANYAVYLISNDQYYRARAITTTIAAMPTTSFNAEAETFQNVAHLHLLLALNGQYNGDLHELVIQIEAGLARYHFKINAARRFAIWFNLILLFLIEENFRAARKYIDHIIDHRRYKIRVEVQYITRILELVIYNELEIWDTPESTVVAVYRYLSRKDELTPFKFKVLGTITKLSATQLNLRMDVYQKLYEELDPTYCPPQPKHGKQAAQTPLTEKPHNVADSLGLLVVRAWAGSRVQGRSIREVLMDLI